jgi:hypothetical protein
MNLTVSRSAPAGVFNTEVTEGTENSDVFSISSSVLSVYSVVNGSCEGVPL